MLLFYLVLANIPDEQEIVGVKSAAVPDTSKDQDWCDGHSHKHKSFGALPSTNMTSSRACAPW
jgi:hypothetical protein